MRKQELIQLHALCVVIRSHVEARHDVPPDAFRAYDEYGVPPTAIHRRKDAHWEALRRLLAGLTAVTGDRPAAPEHRPSPLKD